MKETQQPDPLSRNTRRKSQVDDNMETDDATLDLTDRELERIQDEIVHLFLNTKKKAEPALEVAVLSIGSVSAKTPHEPKT